MTLLERSGPSHVGWSTGPLFTVRRLTGRGELRPYHVAKVEEVCFSPDGTQIASASIFRKHFTIKLWDVTTDEADHPGR